MRYSRRSQNEQRQRKRVYAAEDECPEGFRFRSIAEIRSWVRSIVQSDAWVKNNGPVEVRVLSNGDRDASEAIWPDAIWIADSMRTQKTVLHELAHLLAGKGTGHGKEFVAAYLVLAASFWGHVYVDHLQRAFKRHGVK